MKKNNYPGKFIVIEGLDGSGKSTQLELLAKFLEGKGKKILLTKEPTLDSEAGRIIKKVLKREIKMDSLELQKLYIQDREEHLKNKVIPALKEGKFVISSRYAFSTFAYGVASGLDINLLIEMNKDFLLPDLTIIIDVNPESCMERIGGRGGERELFEELEKLKKVREVYKELPERFDNVFVINGEKEIKEVFQELKNLVEQSKIL